jgi:putative flippase GtrA
MEFQLKNALAHIDRSFYRFLVVGISNFSISFAIFSALSISLPPFQSRIAISQGISYCCGILWSFIWNKKWSFSEKGGNNRSLFSKFVALQILLLFLSTWLIQFLISFLLFGKNIAWFCTMFIITLLNFSTLKLWVFRK